MLSINPLKKKLAAKTDIFGILNSVPSPVITEMFAYAGYDFVILDTEHLLISDDSLAHSIRAAECAGIPALVRVPNCDPARIGKILDAGAQGIVVSRVSDLDSAKVAIEACKYPPLGNRGITGGRTTGFGTLPLAEYIENANNETFIGLMIEDVQGLDALAEIVQLPHLDMIFEGALDLSLSMGHGIHFNHENVQAAIHKMADISLNANIPFCAIPRLSGQKQQWQAKGVNTFLVGEDRGFIFKELKNKLNSLKS
ncbi:HpcH/HpaI aldolase family protein [Shewanella surugensis]|uniref:Aldolase/citrate lyase family protein n=1 Tax=Shewanella surugensis TaxID=212020 RepID=A0ABT0LCK5_9GAMM|nr:aldolase/citrate lyase family protein [Shewanella surugensis]MCL1125423.1 aldolase/citrate lyase family protein [Shewanella surugensis]